MHGRRSYGLEIKTILAVILLASFALAAQSCSIHRDLRSRPAPGDPYYGTLVPAPFDESSVTGGRCLPGDCLALAVKEAREGSTSASGMRLVRLRRQMTGTVWAARASFVLALQALEKEGGSADALRYLKEAEGIEEIGDYVSFYRARAFKASGDEALARREYARIADDHPGSILRASALAEIATLLRASGRDEEALEYIREFTGSYPDDPRMPELLFEGASIAMKLRETETAAKSLRALLTDFPAHEASQKARALVSWYEEATGVPLELTDEELYTRGMNLYREAMYEEAEGVFASIMERSAPSGVYDRAALRRVISKVRQKEFDSAYRLAGSITEKVSTDDKLTAILYWRGVAAARSRSIERLHEVASNLEEVAPGSPTLGWIRIFTADQLEGRGESGGAREIYREVVENYGGDAAIEAAWRLGWTAYLDGDYRTSRVRFSESLDTAGDSGSAERLLYWIGRASELVGETGEATGTFARLCSDFPDGFYCAMARARGVGIPEPEAPEVRFDPGIVPVVANEPRFLKARELLILGLPGYASEELRPLVEKYARDPLSIDLLASLFYRTGDFHNGQKLYYRLRGLRQASAGPEGVEPPGIDRHAYPMGVVEMVRRITRDSSVDPHLVAAVMREESTFAPGVVSKAGAVGIMQIMPPTAAFIAMKTGAGRVERGDLLDPELNIRLGSWYLGHISKKFDRDIVLTVAGYNAGPVAVSRWVKEGPREVDVFIESIPYTETRTYTKRVLKSYAGFLQAAGTGGPGPFERDVTGSGGRGMLKVGEFASDATARGEMTGSAWDGSPGEG